MFTEMVCCVLAIVLLGSLFLSKKPNKRLPPGPYIWPVIGNIVEMVVANAAYPHLALLKMSKKYGDIMSLGFGVHYTVVISSFEAMKEILIKPEATLTRYAFPYTKDRAFDKENMGIIWNSGESWQELKRYTMRILRDFTFGKRNSMNSIIQKEMDEFVQEIKDRIKPDGTLEVDPGLLAVSAINILWSFMAGYRFSLKDERLHKTVKLNDNILEAMGYGNRYLAFPFVRKWFPKWSQYEKHRECFGGMQDFMKKIIEESKEKRLQRDNKDEPESYLDAFQDEIKKNSHNTQTNFTEEQLIVSLTDMFLAGSETSSTTLNWLILYLALHPDVQKKIYEEILQTSVLCESGKISLNEEPKMPYVKATLLEVHRVANMLPVPGPRSVTKDFTYGNYTIPKGACLMWNLEPVYKDKDYWGDPEVFRPERFLDKTGSKLVKTERIVQFGFGRRICPGESLAMNSLFMFMISLCTNFSFETIPGQQPSTIPKSGSATLSPHTYSLKVTTRH